MKKIILLIGILINVSSHAQFRVYPQTKIMSINASDTSLVSNKIGIKWVNNDAHNIDHLEFIYWDNKTLSVDTEFLEVKKNSVYHAEGKINDSLCKVVYISDEDKKYILLKFINANGNEYWFNIDCEKAISF